MDPKQVCSQLCGAIQSNKKSIKSRGTCQSKIQWWTHRSPVHVSFLSVLSCIPRCSGGHTTVPFLSILSSIPSFLIFLCKGLLSYDILCRFYLLFAFCCLLFVICCLLCVVCFVMCDVCCVLCVQGRLVSERVQAAQNESGKKIGAVWLGAHIKACERI